MLIFNFFLKITEKNVACPEHSHNCNVPEEHPQTQNLSEITQ